MTDIIWSNVTVTLGQLQPWERNPKSISKSHAKRLLASWDKFGQFQTVAIGPGFEVYDGHQRLSVLRAAFGDGYSVAARQSSRELTDSERRELVIAAHVGTTGQFNWDELANWDAAELQEWGLDGEQLQDWKTSIGALTELIEAAKEEPPEDPGAQIDKAEELREKWGVESGQMWKLGEHRLICGDCTDRAVVERVMGGEKAKLLMADPPYNVKYTGGSTNEVERVDSYEDDMSDADYTSWLFVLLKNGFDCTDDKAALMLWFASAKMRCIMDGFENAGWSARTLIVWNKTKAHYGALGAQYKHKYEPMWYCFKTGCAPRFYGATNETTVWDFDQPRVNELHPTMKPVELYERCVRNHSESGDEVLELFSGSGTTIIACERLSRKCRAVEISPAYVAVAIQRWVDMTGGEPVLLSSNS